MIKQKPIPIFQNPHLNRSARFLQGPMEVGFLLIHGFTATTVEVAQLGEFFNKKGYPVSLPLLPGHGTSPQDLNTKKITDWTGCVEAAYLDLSRRYGRVVVGGESMGAVLALHLGASHPEIAALLLYSPALDVPSLKYSLMLKILKPIISKNNYDEEDEMPWQGYTVYPLLAASEFFKLTQLVKKRLSKIQMPVAIFQGRYDQTIDPKVGEYISAHICSSVKRQFKMEDSGHVMLLDREFDQIAETSWEFLVSTDILK